MTHFFPEALFLSYSLSCSVVDPPGRAPNRPPPLAHPHPPPLGCPKAGRSWDDGPEPKGFFLGEGENLPQGGAWLCLPVCTNNSEAPARGERLFMATHSARLVLLLPPRGSPIPSVSEPLVTGINTPGSAPGTAALAVTQGTARCRKKG